jgi:hypothetical protein
MARGARDQRLQRKNRLAAARPAHEQRRSSTRESSGGDLVKALDAAGDFLQDLRMLIGGHSASRLPQLKTRLRAAPTK